MNTPPGKLDWLPAAAHLDLVAAPTAAAVATLGVELWVAAIDAALADTAAFCEAYAVAEEDSANCVVVEGRRGETTTLAAVMISASDRADINKTVRKHLGVRKISFASMDTATDATGMEYGGITPIGIPAGWPLLVDAKAAATERWLIVGSGIRGSKIAIRGTDLAALPGAEVLDLAQ